MQDLLDSEGAEAITVQYFGYRGIGNLYICRMAFSALIDRDSDDLHF